MKYLFLNLHVHEVNSRKSFFLFFFGGGGGGRGVSCSPWVTSLSPVMTRTYHTHMHLYVIHVNDNFASQQNTCIIPREMIDIFS